MRPESTSVQEADRQPADGCVNPELKRPQWRYFNIEDDKEPNFFEEKLKGIQHHIGCLMKKEMEIIEEQIKGLK